VKPIYIFAIEAGVQNLTTTNEYGTYFVMFDFVFLFVFLNDAGIQNYNSRHIASNRSQLGNYFGEILGYKLFVGVFFACTTLLFGLWLGYTLEYFKMLILIIGVFFLNSFFMLLRSSLSAMGKYRWDSYISALDKIILLLILGLLVYNGYQTDSFNIIWYPQVQLIGALLAVLIALYMVYKTGLRISLSFSFSGLKKMILATYPYALLLLFSSAYNRVDGVMLDHILMDGKHQAGMYASAYRFIEAGNMVGFLFASLLLPMLTHLITCKEDYKTLFSFAFKVLAIIGGTIAVICILYADEIYDLIYVDKYAGASKLLSILMLSFIPVSLSHCFGSYLIAKGDLKGINIIFLLGLLLNLVLNYLLIPELKAEGASITTVITQIFLFGGMAVYIDRKNPSLNIDKLLFFMILSILFIGCLGWIINFFISSIFVGPPILLLILLIILYFSGWFSKAKTILDNR
jgi:O-antigen/teichoic acid export membrane protein